MMSALSWQDDSGFSLVNGGPLYRLLCLLRLAGEDRLHVLRRIGLLLLLAWIPLLVLCLIEGTATARQGLDMPLLKDVATNTRFLVAIPLFLIAEVLIDRWCKDVVTYMRWSGLVPPELLNAYNAEIRSVSRLRDSTVIELALFVPIIIFLFVGSPLELSGGITTSWKIRPGGDGTTRAGWWYALVSLPIYQFLLFRWFWRFLLWVSFLWRLSRLPLQILPTHPDRAGGLGFVAAGHSGFSLLIFAGSIGSAAALAERILYTHVSLYDFQTLIITYVVLILLVFLAPLLFFTPLLLSAKRRWLSSYSVLVDKHHRLFAKKWFRGPDAGDETESILGNPDASSLADINSGYETLHNMAIVAVTPRLVLVFTLSAMIPMAPLVLTVIPFMDLLKKIAGLLI